MSEAIIAPTARLGRNVEFGDNVVIEDGAQIGNNVTLVGDVVVSRGAVVGDNSIIGYRENGEPAGLLPVDRLVVICDGAKVRSGAVLYWGVQLGDHSSVGHNAVLREKTIIGKDSYVGSLTAVEGNTIIGNHVGIHTQCHITSHCCVGDYTFIAPLFVGANDNRMQYRRRGHGQLLQGFITERYVRIAVGVTVVPNVRFGEGCIVGVGSVVTKDVPPYKVVMGVPARIVRDAPRDDLPLMQESLE